MMKKYEGKILFVLFIFIAVGRKYFIKEGKETSEDLLLCKNLNFINNKAC